MKLNNVQFDHDFIYATDEYGKTLKQSLLWYGALKEASEDERQNYSVGYDGFHWRNLDVDISFESFYYTDAIPTPLQEFFLIHKEINVSQFAKRVGINPTLLLNYINGFKKPSKKRESEILRKVKELGWEYVGYCTSIELCC